MRSASIKIRALFNRNIVGLHGLGALSMAHTEKEISNLKDIIKEISHPIAEVDISKLN